MFLDFSQPMISTYAKYNMHVTLIRTIYLKLIMWCSGIYSQIWCKHYLIWSLSESNMKKKKKKKEKKEKRQCSFMNYTNECECHLNSINKTRTYIHIKKNCRHSRIPILKEELNLKLYQQYRMTYTHIYVYIYIFFFFFSFFLLI